MTTKTEASPANPTGARTESFKEELRSLKIKDPNAGREAAALKAGYVVMSIGIVLTIMGYFISHQSNAVGTLNDAQQIAMVGIALTVAGAAAFLRYSFASFMRFWLARFIFEQQKDRD